MNIKKWQKHPILALFRDFLQGPLRELAENRSTSSVLRARQPRAIGLDVLFWRDLF